MWREEDQMKDRQRVGFPYPAAFWNGTSFSAPKVSAAIAARVAPTSIQRAPGQLS